MSMLDEKDNNRIINVKSNYLYIKRVIDFLGSLIGLIVLIPLFLVIVLLIKADDPKGPVFYKQIRVGKNGKEFYMYKFRSMYVDAESRLDELLSKNDVGGAMFKMKNDPRVTKIGKFIRKTSLDEFPQLLNVLKGDMSLVGPRPPLPHEVEQYTAYDKQRLTVIPGCTGLWQISGRNNVGFDKMVELDLQYIESISLMNDVKIIVKTVGVIFEGDAY